MPYAYVERFAVEAFTGPATMTTTNELDSVKDSDPQFQPYLHPLKEKAVDIEGKICKQDEIVLSNPREPDAFLENSPANREKFRRRDFTWTDRLRREIWFPPPAQLPAETRTKLQAVLAEKQKFMAALDANLKAAKGSRCPVEFLPKWRAWFPLLPPARFDSVEVLAGADLHESFESLLYRHSDAPEGLGWLFRRNDALNG